MLEVDDVVQVTEMETEAKTEAEVEAKTEAELKAEAEVKAHNYRMSRGARITIRLPPILQHYMKARTAKGETFTSVIVTGLRLLMSQDAALTGEEAAKEETPGAAE